MLHGGHQQGLLDSIASRADGPCLKRKACGIKCVVEDPSFDGNVAAVTLPLLRKDAVVADRHLVRVTGDILLLLK